MTKPTAELPLPGSADIPFTLDGEELFLKPSLKACISISRMHNNPHETASKVMAMDFDTIAAVVGFGLDRPVSKALQEKVYKTGLVELRPALISFIHIVNNGGRPLNVDEEAKGDEDEAENPPSPSL